MILGDIPREQLEMIYKVADNTNVMLAYWDDALICRFANSAFLDWFGVPPEQMINSMHMKQLLGPLFKKNWPFIKNALEGKLQVFEREIVLGPGKRRTTIATYTPDIVNGKVKGFYVHIADANNLKEHLVKVISAGAGQQNMPGPLAAMGAVEATLRDSLLKGFPGIKQLAKQHHVSESKLKRDFKTRYNATVFSYFRHLQMQLAEIEMRTNGYSKKQMAAMLKFSNPSNFVLCYKKYIKQKAAAK